MAPGGGGVAVLPGDVFGEIALIHEERTTASVTAATQCTVLFLSRERFAVLVKAVKEIREYIEQLGDERLMDTQLTLDGGDIDDDMLML